MSDLKGLQRGRFVLWAKAFCPGHITGFFEICDQHKDLVKRGSRGAGVSITRGAITSVILKKSSLAKVDVNINGEPDVAPVTRSVISQMSKLAGGSSTYRVIVNHETQIPVGCGMGSSGAGAWGTALALNQLFNLSLTHDKIGQIAHRAEVENGTGLGTVLAQQRGGIEIRSIPGAPGVGYVDNIPFNPDLRVVCSSKGAISTKAMLNDSQIRKKINRFGGALVDRILAKASPEALMQLSREFSDQTKLPSENLRSGLELLDSHGFHDCSMALFGETIFSLVEIEEAKDIIRILKEWNKLGETFSAEIDTSGARLTGCGNNG